MTEHVFEQMRRAMVASQLRTTGVNDARVVAAMGAVPRERFIPEDRCALAYADALVDIGHGRRLSSPMALGRMLTEARLAGSEKSLVIGSGTGYSAAVLARLTSSVVAVEEVKDLADFARSALEGTGVEVVTGPLVAGHVAGAPYDFILIDGAVEHVPDSLIDQIAEGGQFALAWLDSGVSRLAVGRVVAETFGVTVFADVAAVLLPGFENPRGFTF